MKMFSRRTSILQYITLHDQLSSFQRSTSVGLASPTDGGNLKNGLETHRCPEQAFQTTMHLSPTPIVALAAEGRSHMEAEGKLLRDTE